MAPVTRNLGVVSHAAGRIANAGAEHTNALTIAEQVEERYEQARALAGLGHVWYSRNNLVEAYAHWERALRGFTELGVPDAEQLSTQLPARPLARGNATGNAPG